MLMETESRAVLNLSQACRLLAEAKTLEDVLTLRDQVQTLHHYMKLRGGSEEAQRQAAELKIRAERKLGELIPTQFQHGGDRKTASRSHGATLTDVGIEKTAAHRWQKIASIPEEQFEQHIAEAVEQNRELTTAGVLRFAKTLQQPGKQEQPFEDGCTVADLSELARRGPKFGTIYADPPWAYGNQATRASTDNHYQTMDLEAIKSLPVASLVADNAHLHLWTTNAFLALPGWAGQGSAGQGAASLRNQPARKLDGWPVESRNPDWLGEQPRFAYRWSGKQTCVSKHGETVLSEAGRTAVLGRP